MIQEKIISILGAGESGVGAALLAKAKGYTVYVSDGGPIAEKYKQELSQNGIPFEENDHTLIKLCTPMVVKSPGIPNDAKIVQQLMNIGSDMISEIEWGCRFTLGTKISITGTNGKTTTTKLIHHLLSTAGKDAALVGNIGISFARVTASEKHDYWVIEASSFQLEGLRKYRTGIGVLLNITPDHLDRYDQQFDIYADTKFNMVHHVDANGALVVNLDDPTISTLIQEDQPRCELLGFGLRKRDGLAAWRTDEELVFEKPRAFTIPLAALTIKGEHNQLNAMAAVLAAVQAGVEPEEITEGLLTFQPEPHRMQEVGTRNGVTYINDSKATNVDAVQYALGAFRQPIVWIAGGVDKGNDYGQLLAASAMVKGLVALGKDNEKLKENFGDFIPEFSEARSMAEAVKIASEMADEGDVVLLSPACASFDLFKNYEDRGNQFIKAVQAL